MTPKRPSSTKAQNKLQFLRPHETKRIKKARARRPLAELMRWALPISAMLLLAGLAIWPMVNPNRIKAAIMKNIPDIVVRNPHYTGTDNKNQPYSLSAALAKRPSGMANIYDLDKPQGELTLNSGNWLYGKAEHGRFDQESRKLWLGGNVQLYHDKGMQFTSEEAQVDIEGNFAWGEKPVLIQGNFGEIRGQGFRLLDDGKTMIVKGPAKAILTLSNGAASDKGPAVKK